MPVKKPKSTTKKILESKSSRHLPTALVAGAAGFVGSHLCDALLSQNCKVYGIDNWSTGKKENISHLLDKPEFVFLEHDLNKPFKSPIPQVDYVFHLAGIEAYINGLDVSLETLLVNSLGTRELLELAKKSQAKFLLVSTIDISSGFLSDSNLKQYFGSNSADQEIYSHHEAKRFSEALTFEYVNRHQQDARIVRLGEVYGPRMDLATGRELANFFLTVKKNQPLKVVGNGLKQLRPTYISDIIYGLIKAMFSQSSDAKIFTLVQPEAITVLNLAYKIKELFPDKKLNIEFIPGSEDPGLTTLSPAILDSQQELGWVSKISLEEGINHTTKWLATGKTLLPDTDDLPSAASPPADKPLTKDTLKELGITPTSPIFPPPSTPSFPKTSLKDKLKKLPYPKFRLPKKKLNSPHQIKLSLSRSQNIFSRLFKPKLSRRKKIGLFSLIVFLIWFLAPLAGTALYAFTAAKNLSKASQFTSLTQITQAKKFTVKAQSQFDTSRNFLSRSQWFFRLIGQTQTSHNLDRLLFIGSELSQGALHVAQAGESGTLLSQIIFHHQEGNLNQAINQVKINLDQAYIELSFVESELQSGQQLATSFSLPLAQKIQTASSVLPTIRKKIDQARLLLPFIPGFIAQDSKKNYLVLLQNSAELRPTGGFIGSYAILSFENGKLLDFSVEDIYSADGQLQGYVEPPEPIKKAFGNNTWYFRDSNWNPDFSVSAQKAEWFLQKTTNRTVDGVIVINLPAVKYLLEATGPIEIPDYNEAITADNLFERAEYYSEIDFFPGSTQKKDFLGALSREIFAHLQEASASDLLQLTQALETSLNQKQILAYLHDQPLEKILIEQNWAGTIYNPSLDSLTNLPVTQDYTFLVEANLGVNKANYFLRRELTQQLTILKTKEILVTTTINYNNQSPADTWPGGVYKSYLRHYIPPTAKPISIRLGDQKLNLEKDVDVSLDSGKIVLGFFLSVPVKNSLEVEITYRLPQLKLKQIQTPGSDIGLSSDKRGRLAIVIPKQPGIIDDSIKTIVNYPSFLSVATLNPPALSSPQVVTFQSTMETDRVFSIDFIEK